MKKQEFRELLKNKRLILDGATGSILIKNGMTPGVCPEKWILEHPDVLINMQLEYLRAGSNIVYSPTFTSNSVKLAEYGIGDKVEEFNTKLVALSKEAIRIRRLETNDDTPLLVAGDLTMTGKQLRPIGTFEVEELIEVYKEQIRALDQAGVDLLVVETMISLQECRCALIAAKEVSELPVMISMSFEENGRGLYGTDPLTALVTLQSLGADAFGVNCSTGPDKMSEIIHKLTKYSEIPLICKPNAGLPSLLPDGSTGYSMDAAQFGEEMIPILEAGTALVGGCCGTSPDYIRELKKKVDQIEYKLPIANHTRMVCSERETCLFDLDSNFIIVGERINPTGKKKLQAELREGSFELVREFAEQQQEKGARILDINMGMSGINEKDMMKRAIEEVTQTVNLPLCIDSSDPNVMESALRHYPGRALINSVSFEAVKMEKMLPLVKKYGAMFILLPLSDKGLPENLQEKKDIIHTILEKALELGIKKEDIIVDGLVTTVGANKKAALETLETIRYCKVDLQLATICGLSNISFGLPERSYINASFLTMAIAQGLTMAIANPNQDLLTNTAFAADLLRNKAGADVAYIEHINAQNETSDKNTVKDPAKDSVNNKISDEEILKNAVLKGNKERITEYTKNVLDTGKSAADVLNDILLPAINLVGDYFDRGTYFLPQLISSAEAMKTSIDYLEPLLQNNNNTSEQKQNVVVFATVQGDIHDIGKNLVVMMLKNHGFKVIDLGKDVSAEEIIQTALKENAEIIALSALMTTTMKQMKVVIDEAKKIGLKSKIMIGGAVITKEYADEIGADGYSKDAAEAVRVAKSLVG